MEILPPADLLALHEELLNVQRNPASFEDFVKRNYLNEQGMVESCQPDLLDRLLAQGWRHQGCIFFRYNLNELEGNLHWILPLRVVLEHWRPSKSQRKILHQNADLLISWDHYRPSEEKNKLFLKHATRFKSNQPGSLDLYVLEDKPCQILELSLRTKEQKLVACSLLSVGSKSLSSIYAFFDLDESSRSLGIYTFLLELEYARKNQYRLLYPGYATLHPSLYDYKKSLYGLEYFDWRENWRPMPRGGWKDTFTPIDAAP